MAARWSLLVLSALASCRAAPPAAPAPAGSVELELKVAALEQRLGLLEKLLAARDAGPIDTTPVPADSVARVDRLEQRLGKVVAFLKQAVRPEVDASQVYAVPIDPSDPSLGPSDAAVTMIEAFEFYCP